MNVLEEKHEQHTHKMAITQKHEQRKKIGGSKLHETFRRYDPTFDHRLSLMFMSRCLTLSSMLKPPFIPTNICYLRRVIDNSTALHIHYAHETTRTHAHLLLRPHSFPVPTSTRPPISRRHNLLQRSIYVQCLYERI